MKNGNETIFPELWFFTILLKSPNVTNIIEQNTEQNKTNIALLYTRNLFGAQKIHVDFKMLCVEITNFTLQKQFYH